MAIKYTADDCNCNGEDDEHGSVGGLGNTSIVHHAVIRNVVTDAELAKGGLEAMDVVCEVPPTNKYDEGHNNLKEPVD